MCNVGVPSYAAFIILCNFIIILHSTNNITYMKLNLEDASMILTLLISKRINVLIIANARKLSELRSTSLSPK